MRRKFLALVAVLAVGFLCAGCMGVTRKEMAQHWRGRFNAFQGGLRNITYFVDRHLLNYTWDDPYAFDGLGR